MPSYGTVMWDDHRELQEIEFIADSLEEARHIARNPTLSNLDIADVLRTIDRYDGESIRYRPYMEATVSPTIRSPRLSIFNEYVAPYVIDTCSRYEVQSGGSVFGDLQPDSPAVRVVPLTGKIIPKWFTLKEYKIKEIDENLCDF